jgi:type VI secretion system protein ImpK
MLFSIEQNESFLYLCFHEFYSEIVQIKECIQSGGIHLHLNENAPPIPTKITPTYIHQKLLTILERQRVESGKKGGEFGATQYQNIQYLMVGLVDEIFLHVVNWDHKEEWRNNLLETRLFNSYIAGEKIFRQLDQLLKESNPIYADVARIYLIALAIGFQGKYRNLANDGTLERYRRQLFSFITHHDADNLHDQLYFNPDKKLFPSAYVSTVKEPNTQRLPALRIWMVIFILVMIGSLLSSHFLWKNTIHDLEQTMTQIIKGKVLSSDTDH